MREFALFVLESSYQTPMTPTLAEIWTTSGAGTAGAGVAGFVGFYARLDGSDSLTIRPRIVPYTVPYGGGVAIPAFTVGDKILVEGTYKTKLYAGPFGQFLLQWSMQQINTLGYVGLSGVNTGWAYSGGPSGNLPSVYIFHAIQRSDGTYKVRGYAGVKVKSIVGTISEGSTIGDLTLSLVGSTIAGNQWTLGNYTDPTIATFANPANPPTFGSGATASTLCVPATPNLPISPYVFINASGGLVIGTPTRSTFQSLSINCQNKLMTRFWANRFVQFAQFCGRDLTLTAQQFYVNMSPEDRLTYEAITPVTASVALNNGVHSATFTMNTANVVKTLEDSLPLDDIYTQTMTVTSQWDASYAQTDTNLAADFQMSFT
jgi:hypothetical protein